MTCKKCGNETDGENAKFCMFCGHEFEEGNKKHKVKITLEVEMTKEEIDKFLK